MYWVLLSTRETVAGETPAFLATSRIVWLIDPSVRSRSGFPISAVGERFRTHWSGVCEACKSLGVNYHGSGGEAIRGIRHKLSWGGGKFLSRQEKMKNEEG